MAKVLKEFDWNSKPKVNPMDKFLNGQIWQIKAGEDFTSKPENFKQQIKKAAARRGLEVRMSSNEDIIVLQAFEPVVTEVLPETQIVQGE